MQLLQRRFQRFSDDWLRRIMNALRNWQILASKHCPLLPFWNPSANQLGEYLISVDKRGPYSGKKRLDTNGFGSDVNWVELFLLILCSWHRSSYTQSGICRLLRMKCHLVFSSRSQTFPALPRCSRNFRWACDASGYSLFALAIPSPINCSEFQRTVHHREVSLLGKSKVQGKRRAFAWRVPKKVGLCFSILDRVFVLLSTLFIKNPDLVFIGPRF